MCNVLTTQPEELKFCGATIRKNDLHTKHRRRVRFSPDEDNNEDEVHAEILGPLLEPTSSLSEESKSKIWWTKDDFQSFSGNARLLAKEVTLRETSQNKGYKMSFLNGFLSCEKEGGPTGAQRHYLKQWTKAAFSRRGLERWCIEDLDDIRADRRKKSIAAVLDAQDCSGNMDLDRRNEFIKSAYVSRTIGPRRFAILLAEGDQYAIAGDAALKKSYSSSTVVSNLSGESSSPEESEGSDELNSKPERRVRRGSKILLRFRRRESAKEYAVEK